MTATSERLLDYRIGLALGSGSARGWAHIGVLRALEERGVRPTIVSGASTGSLVAASYASQQLDALERWARTLSKIDVWRLLDASFAGGVMRGNRLMRAVAEQLTDRDIESLEYEFGAVAADLYTGREIWIREGSMLEAVRASSGLPGLFTPIRHQGRWLIDGGVVNPVPVSLCRTLGADFVIAVNLNRTTTRFPEPVPDEPPPSAETTELFARWTGLLDNFVSSIRSERGPAEPGLIEVVHTSITIMQDQITRSRLVGDPPDLIIRPQLGDFNLMDFHRASEAIDAGYAAVQRVAGELPASG